MLPSKDMAVIIRRSLRGVLFFCLKEWKHAFESCIIKYIIFTNDP